MSPKTLVLVLVGVGCVGAAGVGSYVAVRTGTMAPAAAPAPSPGAGRQDLPAAPSAPGSASSKSAAPSAASRQRRPTPPVASPRPAGTADARSSATVDAPRAVASRSETVEAPPAPASPTEAAPASVDLGEGAATVEVAPRTFEEITVAENSVIGIRLESPVSSETSRVEDRVSARVTRDVTVDGRTAIPAGATVEGVVTLVQLGSSIKERARVGVQFTTIVLADRSRLPVKTEAIFRDGDAPGGEATAKIGASAVVGAVLGAVIGGRKGAAIGGTVGAAGGTAAVMAGGPNSATIPAGTSFTVRLTAPVVVPVERGR